MKKQVLGHNSKQAPANRTIYHQRVIFRKMQTDSKTDTTDPQKALKWLANGNIVNALIIRDGYALQRNVGLSYTANGLRDISGLVPTCSETTYRTWCKKWDQMPTKYELKHLADINGTNGQVNTF